MLEPSCIYMMDSQGQGYLFLDIELGLVFVVNSIKRKQKRREKNKEKRNCTGNKQQSENTNP